jgi:pyruvate dehydrogenase E2 component (dihydrolipoamide acetyltransferase)
VAADTGLDLGAVAGTGPRGKVTRADVEAALAGQLSAPAGDGRVYATPAARRLAREQDVDLRAVPGSGPKGRVQAADVVAAAQAASMPAPVSAPVAASASLTDIEVVPLQGMRRTIAERMTASYQTVPHIDFTVRVDMTRFNEAREQLNAKAEASGGERISATAMIVKAVASTLARHPYLNASLQGEEIHLRREINVGVAVALDEGLIVPVIRGADRKGLAEIAAEVNDLSARARDGRLVPSDVSGGTFTVSNLGPFGIEQFTAIINPPQSAILAVGATQLEAIPDESGHIAARPILRITLSADHRIVDGAVAARFVSDLKTVLETPVLLSW